MSQERLQIRQEFARYILHSGAAGMWVGFVYGIIWIGLVWQHVPNLWLGLWVVGFAVVVSCSAVFIKLQIRYHGWGTPAHIEKMMFVLMGFGGFYHCLSLLLFFPLLPAVNQQLCQVLLMALIPVMILPLQAHRASFNSFWIPTLIVLAYLIDYQNVMQIGLLMAQVLTWGVINYIQRRSYHILYDVFTRMVENQALVSDLRQANRMMRHRSETDALTGLYNRSMFDRKLDKWWRQSSRSGKPISLLMIDVDYFKAYNDHYGHIQGDQCLIHIADVLEQSILREDDCAFRYGGEEFVVLLPNATEQSGDKVAARIQNRLLNETLVHECSDVSSWVTVSIGIATGVGDPQRSALLLMQQADEALYQAKRAGRNQRQRFVDES
ncbi:GGDEF domain-containing protein [Celerinatantimonas sp. YJH-8]|uniref:GGDEF domain-containing protein n=1 Tax=Celerinatantimonas sp. YJH-8 TaxID=3228714 RepID=UPI0038BEE70F